MAKFLEGKQSIENKKIAIAVSKFNDFITKRLLDACIKELVSCGIHQSDITVAWVPGSFELPLTAQKFAKKKSIHAVICLGAVIRGDTFHFELVSLAAQQGIMDVMLQSGKPVVFGVLTTDTIQQADKRSGIKGDNKGIDAAQTAVEMLNILSQI